MLKTNRKSILRNQKGLASLEMIPILMIIMLLVNFSLGFYGAIHTGILNSIAARNYTFETFRNRANVTYFKNTETGSVNTFYSEVGFRLHGAVSEAKNSSSKWKASSRTIDFLKGNSATEFIGTEQSTHTKTREVSDGQRNTAVGVNPIWIKTAYGICLNAACGS